MTHKKFKVRRHAKQNVLKSGLMLFKQHDIMLCILICFLAES